MREDQRERQMINQKRYRKYKTKSQLKILKIRNYREKRRPQDMRLNKQTSKQTKTFNLEKTLDKPG